MLQESFRWVLSNQPLVWSSYQEVCWELAVAEVMNQWERRLLKHQKSPVETISRYQLK